MKVSVIIPTYNRCDLLPRALDSVLRQTYQAHEVIVVDDGSNDGTRTMIADKYPDVEYVYHENRGVSFSRNRGVEHASSEWVAFLDNDDEWIENKLLLQIEALKENPQFKLCHTEEIWIRNGVRVNAMNKHRKSGGDIFLQSLHLCLISPSSVLMSKPFFVELGGFDETLPACEDYDLWLRACANNLVLFLDQPLLMKYGGHEDQLSRKHWGMDRFRVHALEKILLSSQLNEEKAKATRSILLKKCQILATGALKRGNLEVAKTYQEKLSLYG